MAFNSYISLIKGKLSSKTGEIAIEQVHAAPDPGDASHTKPAADGLVLDAVSTHGGAQDGELGARTAAPGGPNLGDTATHERALHGITTEVEPVELLEDTERGAGPSGSSNLGDTATHERGIGGPPLNPAFQVTGDFAESHADLDSSTLGDVTHERGGNTHSIFTEFTLPVEQVSSDHGGMDTADESPQFGDSERLLSAQGSGSDEQVVGVTEYGTTDLGHTGGVFTFKSTSGMDSDTERMAFSSERGTGPGGGVQKFDDTLGINDQTPADWNERSAAGHQLKSDWTPSAAIEPEAGDAHAAQDVFVTEAVSRPDAASNVSVFGSGGGADDEGVTGLRFAHDRGQSPGFTVKFDGGPGPGGHDVKWEGPDFDATTNAAHAQPESLMLPYVEQGQVVEGRQEALGVLPYMEGQNAVEGDEPTLERQAPDPTGAGDHAEHDVLEPSAAIDAAHATTAASALDAGFTISDDFANSVSSLDSDADAPTTLLGDLHHGDQVYTGVNDGTLLGIHDAAGHFDPGHHDLNDVHHGHEAALDHLPHVDIDLGL